MKPISDTCPWSLQTDAWGRLVWLGADGARHVGVEPVRAFPLTDPDHWVAIVDASGRELGLIENLELVPPELRALLEEELRKREFVPVVSRVIRIKGGTPNSRWIVETDRGRAEFTVGEEDHVRKLGPASLLIIDTAGLRYRIADLAQLDAASRRALEPFV